MSNFKTNKTTQTRKKNKREENVITQLILTNYYSHGRRIELSLSFIPLKETPHLHALPS